MAQQNIDTAIAEERQDNDKSIASQNRINVIDDETDEMAVQYRATLDTIESAGISKTCLYSQPVLSPTIGCVNFRSR